ncbi:MAG TPA: DUF3108 domain-containing protein [Fibrobacteria bacterium]|nr:DUF3108 domain-containing protein [Fibrobacteria bacterium]
MEFPAPPSPARARPAVLFLLSLALAALIGMAAAQGDTLGKSAAKAKVEPVPGAAPGKAKTATHGTTAAPSPVPADTLPPPLRNLGQKALKVPEKLLFDIIWGGWSFRWITAGQATLELLPTEKPYEWKIQSLAWCNGFFQSFYPVNDTVVSIIDSRGIYPLRFDKHLNEGSYHADISARYDQVGHTLKTQDTTLSIEPFTHDVLSAFYFIRTQHLQVGDTLDLEAVSGKKKYKLKVLCHGRETIKVPAGEFRTLVVEPVLKGDGLFKAKGKLTIWVTDDESHTPVKMVSKIPVGSIKAELVSKT